MKLLLALLLCSSSYAETFKLQCIKDTTCHGNAFAVSKNTLLTCWHLVKDKDTFRVLINDEWVAATVVKKSEDDDLCLLKIKPKILTPVEFGATKVVTVVGSERSQIKEHTSLAIKEYTVELKHGTLKSSYYVGISGSPVMEDGKVIGMIVSIDSDENPTESTFISSAAIKKFLE